LKKSIVISWISLLFVFHLHAQHSIDIKVALDTVSNVLSVEQHTLFYNTSNDTLKRIYFHDWGNAFSDKNSELGKRFVENYKKKFFFTASKNRGYTKLFSVVLDEKPTVWVRKNSFDDYFFIDLKTPLLPDENRVIDFVYQVKIPHAKFTEYGVRHDTYNLRYWCLTPVVYNGEWQLMSHLDMDDLYQNPIDYSVQIVLPESYKIESNLEVKKTDQGVFQLSGRHLTNFEMFISRKNEMEQFLSDSIRVVTNINSIEIDHNVKEDLVTRQLLFLKDKLGSFPHSKLFLNKSTYTKNPLYGFNQLPSFLRPFSDTFEWDLRLFKVLINYYINDVYQGHTRKNVWLIQALQSYLMMQYVEAYYPEVKLLGGISNIWGIKSYHIADLDFNERYNTVYQYVARVNLDQPITTPTDSLTNFNRLVANKYKAGLGLRYLEDYIGADIVSNAIKIWYNSNSKEYDATIFGRTITSMTPKDVSWFFDGFIQTDQKIDYKLAHVKASKDSIYVTVKNKTKTSYPISLSVKKQDTILSKYWLQGGFDKKTLVLPYREDLTFQLNEHIRIPEINTVNNFGAVKQSFFKKPIHIRWLGDAENTKAHQLIFEPNFTYNLYDGFVLASTFSNKVLVKKDFKFELTPAYAFKSQSMTGFFKMRYWKHIDHTSINSFNIGVGGAYFHYKPGLAYRTLTPYAGIYFKRKNLRSVKSSGARISFTMVDREIDSEDLSAIETSKYNILNLSYKYSNPEIINHFSFYTNLELGSKFSKLSSTLRFRKLTNSKRQFDVRLFTGIFLHNKTRTDFFSFGLNRPHDYSFRYHYFGRSETSGFLSQQIIINDAGFKSESTVPYANQWVSSVNTSIGLWRWFEVYSDFGFAKNKGENVFFMHDKGVRLNFVNDIFEIYFPLHSNNGWEIAQPHYEERIRFVFSTNFSRIYNFMRRGFM